MNPNKFTETPLNTKDNQLKKSVVNVKQKLDILSMTMENRKNALNESKLLVKTVYDTYTTEHRSLKRINVKLEQVDKIKNMMDSFERRIKKIEDDMKTILTFTESIINDVEEIPEKKTPEKTIEKVKKKTKKPKKVKKKKKENHIIKY